MGAGADMTRVTLGKSRVRESRTPGSVRAKAEWLSYSTVTAAPEAFTNATYGAPLLQRTGGVVEETAALPRSAHYRIFCDLIGLPSDYGLRLIL
jgi:hypothetical protein